MGKQKSNRFFKTSWQNVSQWYNEALGKEGNYYYRSLIIPKVIKLLKLQKNHSLLDLGCGQGILSRYIPKDIDYYGLDLAQDLLFFAQKYKHNNRCHFIKADITQPLPLEKKDFSHSTMILTLQNVSNPELAIKNAAQHLVKNGCLVIVLNHPCFRIPRQSSWEIDEENKIQYRRINRYLSPLRIPINMRPSRKIRSYVTWSFHLPLSSYSQFLNQAGFLIEKIEEWVSEKTSLGKAAKMENRTRKEFPLFLAITARKLPQA